jgi:alpha-ketoglutarate-dependent taurine dioxygenase
MSRARSLLSFPVNTMRIPPAAAPSTVMLVSDIRKDGKPIGELPDGEMWFHSDQCYTERPCAGATLYAIELPSRGGNTLFANMYAACEALPKSMQSRPTGLKAKHIYDYHLNTTAQNQAPSADAPRYAHPIVRTHLASGRKALYAKSFAFDAVNVKSGNSAPHRLHRTYLVLPVP